LLNTNLLWNKRVNVVQVDDSTTDGAY